MNDSPTDIFYQAASVWNELTEYNYILTYGYKNKLYTINLTFSSKDFPHLAGFQYLKDISLPRYNSEKIIFRILDETIKLEQIQKADYIISRHSDITSFVFIIQSNAYSSAKCNYLCCSTFKQGDRDYESNQRPLALLKKERIHISSGTSTVLMDKFAHQTESGKKKGCSVFSNNPNIKAAPQTDSSLSSSPDKVPHPPVS